MIRDKVFKRVMSLFVVVSILMGVLFGSIMGIAENRVYAETTSNYSAITVLPMKDTNWSIQDKGHLDTAMGLLKANYNELNSLRVKVEAIPVASIVKDYDKMNDLIKFELVRTQIIYLKNLIEHQVNERDNLELTPADREFIDSQVVAMIDTTRTPSYQERFGKLHEAYKLCADGQATCGPRTNESSGVLMTIDNLKLPETEESGEIKTTDRQRLTNELKNITDLIETTMDLTEPTNIGDSDSADRLAWLTANAAAVADRMKMMKLLISVYEGLGLDKEVTDSTGLLAKLNNNHSKLKQLVEGADLNIDVGIGDTDPSGSSEELPGDISKNPLEGLDLNEINDLIDTKTNDMSSTYKGLFSWTSNFTPFESNINDPFIMASLTQEERDVYSKYGQNRSIIYSAEGDKGVIKGLKEGVPYQFKVISLGEFLDKVEVKEMALFIKNQSTQVGEMGQVLNDITNSTPPTTDATDVTETPPPAPAPAEKPATGIFNWLGGKDKEPSGGNNPNWFSIADSTDGGGKALPPKFVGPIYATSGSLAKEVWGVGDAGDKSVENVFYKAANDLKDLGNTLMGKNTSINRLKGNTMNMNYFLMYNTIKNKSHLAPAIEEDMNKPMYVDFLGNVLTQSGYVIIPAGANYTYYNYSDKLPAFNAMFLNSYPEVIFNEKQTYTMMDTIEKEKMIYQKSKDGIIRLSKLDKNGGAVKESIYTLPLLTKAQFSEGSISVNFMDDITMFKQSSNPFTMSDTTNDEDKDLTFINTGVVMKTVNEGVERVVNLKKISGDGRGIDWKLIKDANMMNIENTQTRIIDHVTLASLAGTVKKSTDGQVSIVLNDYKSKDDRLRDEGGITSTIGELFEGFHNRFISSLGLNYLLYTPKNSEATVLGNLAQYGIQLMVVISVIAIIIFLFQFVIALYQSDMVGIKSLLGSIVAIILITAITLFATDPLVDLIYNKPAQMILKDELPIYILEDIEQTYKDQDSSFFDKSDKKDPEASSTITIEKLKNKDVEMLRKELTQTGQTESIFYLPTLDQSRLNILGDKVYLQGKDLKINTKDLMEISKVEDVIGPDLTLQLKATYTGYGELAYYMPYFNILDSFVGSLNSYTDETKPPFRLIQYRKGFTKSTGRAEDFFKSVIFLSPDMLDDHVRSLMQQYQSNEVTKDFYTNQYTIDKNRGDQVEDPTNPETPIEGELVPDTNPDGIVVGPETDTQDDVFGQSYFQDSILPISMSNELLTELSNINNIYMYLNFHSNIDFRDWLGLKKVLLLEADESIFPMNYHHVIKDTKWFPDLTAYNDEELLANIYEVNANTRTFVVDKLIPISGKVSDDTLIKIVSLYATMEFNKVFQQDGVKLYPRSIDLAGLSNEYTTKSVMIPQEQIFVGNSHRTALYIAKEAGWTGLLLAFADRIMYFIRMCIRIGVIKVILVSTPIVALYLYISKKNKYSNYIMGAVVSSIMITLLYMFELVWYKVAYNIVNSKGTMSVLVIGIIPQLILTAMYIFLVKVIFSDLMNFGYNGIRERALGAMGAVNGFSYNDAYEQVSEDFGSSPGVDGMSGLSMRSEDGYEYGNSSDDYYRGNSDRGTGLRMSNYEEDYSDNDDEVITTYVQQESKEDSMLITEDVIEPEVNMSDLGSSSEERDLDMFDQIEELRRTSTGSGNKSRNNTRSLGDDSPLC